MKLNTFLFLLIVLSSVRQVRGQASFTLTGQTTDQREVRVYLYRTRPEQASELLDSSGIDRRFRFRKMDGTEPGHYFLTLDQASGQFHFVWDNNLVINLNPYDIRLSTVEGSLATATWRDFQETVEKPYERKMADVQDALRQAVANKDTSRIQQLEMEQYQLRVRNDQEVVAYIKTYQQTWTGLFLLNLYSKTLRKSTVVQLLEGFAPAVRASQLGRRLSEVQKRRLGF